MTKYLLVAEVDKIQSFVFRSSRLREVAGASRLLENLQKNFINTSKTMLKFQMMTFYQARGAVSGFLSKHLTKNS
ncbi:hypothetical protein HC928_10085 [bacterium]|nr:hypothetical protein [bacterium]